MKSSNPILLFLHGGPGGPIPFCEGCRGMFPEWTSHYTMAIWNQLGCGKNNQTIDDSFRLDTFVKMSVDLVKNLKKDFPNNKLVIFGNSWGSILAAKTAEQVPELIDKVFIYGQLFKNFGYNQEVFSALEAASLNSKEKTILKNAEENKTHTSKDTYDLMSLVQKHTEGYQAKNCEKFPVGKLMKGIFGSPDCSLKEFFGLFNNGYKENTTLMVDMVNVDLTDTLSNIKVPYEIIQGSTDIVTSTSTISHFVAGSSNNNLSIKIVPNSGHFFTGEALRTIKEELFAFK